VLPPEETKVDSLPPAWVTDELIEKTVRVWSKIHGRAISTIEAIEILTVVGRLFNLLHPRTATGAEDSG